MKDVIIIDSTLPFINNSFNYIFTELTGHNTSFDIIIKKIEELPLEKIILLPDKQNKDIDRIKKICDENPMYKGRGKAIAAITISIFIFLLYLFLILGA